MKKLSKVSNCILVCLALAMPSHALAAKEKKEKKEKIVKAVSPPKDMVALPEPEAPPPVVSTFPILPPSNPCTQQDVLGLFHLVNVYEEPVGDETTSFATKPNQYLRFYKNKIFARAVMDQPDMTAKDVEQAMKGHSSKLLQYVMQDNGFIYFYQDGVATDVQACFIVANDKIPFKKDQLLLIPPKGQIEGRRAKVYENMDANKKNQADKDEAATGQKNAKKNKVRRKRRKKAK